MADLFFIYSKVARNWQTPYRSKKINYSILALRMLISHSASKKCYKPVFLCKHKKSKCFFFLESKNKIAKIM